MRRRPAHVVGAALAAACLTASACAGAASDERATGPGPTGPTSSGAAPASTPAPTPVPTGGAGTATTGLPAPDPFPVDPSAVTSAAPTTGAPSSIWDASDAALAQRVNQAGLGGGYLVVLRDGRVIHERQVGGVGRTTSMGVASSAKWYTSAVLMSLVDEGRVTLDDPIGRWLPEFANRPGVTLRRLLSHTSGIRDKPCIWNTGGDMAACVRQLAASPYEFEPGTAFSYGNASFHVAGRLAEVAGGRDFATLFRERVGAPLGMTGTSWPGAGHNPSPAAGVSTNAEDYLRFLELMAGGGVYQGRRILSAESVAEIQRDQVKGFDTSHDYSVGITRIPTYGFGLWRDKVDAGDRAVWVSGNGGDGFYPWIDYEKRTIGVLAVSDRRGAEVAVPASHKVVDIVRNATPVP